MPTPWRAIAGLTGLACAGLTACAPATTPPVAAPAPAPVAPAAAPPATDTSPTSTPERGGPSRGQCRLRDLSPAIGRTTGSGTDQHVTTIVWTNSSTTTCTMVGFGGVDLQGPPDPMGPTFSLRRSSKDPAPVRLAPGDQAHTTITWLPPDSGPGWKPTRMLVTPPDETHAAVFDWPGGPVLRQDGATHPGTFLDPVAPGTHG